MDDDILVGETDIPGQKLSYHNCLLMAMLTCNNLLARINEIPPGIIHLSATLSDDELKPNRLNYVNAVDAIEITMHHLLSGDNIKRENVKFKEELDELSKRTDLDVVDRAKMKHRLLMRVMAFNSLLPLQSI